jgi:hypothetical protein
MSILLSHIAARTTTADRNVTVKCPLSGMLKLKSLSVINRLLGHWLLAQTAQVQIIFNSLNYEDRHFFWQSSKGASFRGHIPQFAEKYTFATYNSIF